MADKKFDNFLLDRNDAIDNAAYDLAYAIFHKKNAAEKTARAETLIKAIVPTPEDVVPEADGLSVKVVASAESVMDRLGENIPLEGGDLDWSIHYIGEIVLCVEMVLDRHCIDVCHPFYETNTDPDYGEDDDMDDEDDDDEYDAGTPCYRGIECPAKNCPMLNIT